MPTKPDVRPNVSGHPDPERRNPRIELATRLFYDKGGESMLQDLTQISTTLQLYDQDLERAGHNLSPEKFHWRINPSISIRLRAERRKVEAAIDKLMEWCRTEAARMLAENDNPAAKLATERPEGWTHDSPAPESSATGTEVAHSAPIHTGA
jgi:hypothetical protein